jgi:hypothetical protein
MQRMTRIGVASLVTLAMAGSLVSCGDESQLSAEAEQIVREEGSAATRALMETLQTNLVAAMQEGGPVHAVEFCTGQALTLTDSVARDLGEGITLKRVSNRHRNPVNAPDAEEVKALRHFEAVLEESGSLPKDWVQRTPGGDLRYYRPLVIAPPCLTCHGDPAGMDPAVVSAIQQKYPDDHATGYEVGDLRGLVRVGISRDRIDLDSSG